MLYNFSKHSGRASPRCAGGARERDDSEVPPQEGEELGLEEEPLVGRKRMQSQNKASFVQFCSLFYLVSEPILNFK